MPLRLLNLIGQGNSLVQYQKKTYKSIAFAKKNLIVFYFHALILTQLNIEHRAFQF